jgi:hypothetical protein
MLCRLEGVDDDEFVVRDADTDDVVGLAVCNAQDDPEQGRRRYTACHVLNFEFGRIALSHVAPSPAHALSAVGAYELAYPWRWEKRTPDGVLRGRRNRNGWLVTRDGQYLMDGTTGSLVHFQKSDEAKRAAVKIARSNQGGQFYWLQERHEREAGRIERRLGTVLADTVSAIAASLIEHDNGGVTAETWDRARVLNADLAQIWYASRFGAYDFASRVTVPYFAGPHGRMNFAHAAPHYGMAELQRRFPNEDEGFLRKMLSLVLEGLSRTILSVYSMSPAAERALAEWPAQDLRQLELELKAA